MTDYYFIFNANAPDLVDIMTSCYRKHKLINPLTRTLSEKVSHDGQTYFCKISDCDQPWIDAQNWSPGALIMALPNEGESSIGYQVQRAWNYAQCPIFYPNNAPTGVEYATAEQRHEYWYGLWQSLLVG